LDIGQGLEATIQWSRTACRALPGLLASFEHAPRLRIRSRFATEEGFVTWLRTVTLLPKPRTSDSLACDFAI